MIPWFYNHRLFILWASHDKSGNNTKMTWNNLKKAKFVDLINNKFIVILLIYAMNLISSDKLSYCTFS